MNPDEKYMFQVNLDNTDIKFVPPTFINKKLHDNVIPDIRNNTNLDLFSSERGFPELCYYSNGSDYPTDKNVDMYRADDLIPTTFDILRNLDLDLDETEDLERACSDNDVNKIYAKIEQRNPGIFATLYSYRIPRPIVRVIVKRLIKISLSYCNKDKKH